jgi:hypothetical protein
MYLGSWAINDVLTFSVNTHSFSTGVATNADSAPTYRVYEDNTATPLLTGSMTAFDSANAVGQYVAQITLTAASGFEVGKTYTIRIAATVGGVTGACVRTFQVGAKVNTVLVAGTSQTARDLGNALPVAAPGANGGLPTTNGSKLLQTADLTAGQTISATVTDKTGFALTSAEHSLISGTDVPAGLTAQGYTTTRAGYLDTLNGIVAAIWNALTSGMSTVGSIGKRIADYLDVAVSSRGTGAALDAAGVRGAVGLASANLDTQLSGISGKTNLIPASPAAVGSAMTLAANAVNANAVASDAVTKLQNGLSTYQGTDTPGTTTLLSRLSASWASLLDVAVSSRGTGTALDAAGVRSAVGLASANLDTQLGGIKAKTDLIPASPAAVGSAMTLAPNSVNAAAIATGAIDADSIASDAVTKLQNGLSTYQGTDTPGTTTLLSRLSAAWASLLDVAVSTRGTGTALDAAGVRSAVGLASANLDTQLGGIKAKTDLLPASPAAVGSAMTLAANSVNTAAIATGAIDADSIAADAVTKLQNGLSTYQGTDTPGTTTLLNRLSASWASLLDVAVSSRGTGTALTAGDVRAAIGMATANLDAQLAALPTTAHIDARTLPSASYALQSSLDAHLPAAIKRNQPLPAFTFQMIDATDHATPLPGLTVTARRKLDGGAWATCTNPVTFDATAPVPTYMIDLDAADLNGAVVTLAFTASGADPLQLTILTQA